MGIYMDVDVDGRERMNLQSALRRSGVGRRGVEEGLLNSFARCGPSSGYAAIIPIDNRSGRGVYNIKK